MSNVFTLAEGHSSAKKILEDGTVGHKTAAGSLGISEAAVRRYRTRYGITLQDPIPGLNTEAPEEPAKPLDVSDVPVRDLQVENIDLRASNKRLFGALSKEKDKASRLIQAVYDAARDAAENVTPAKATPRPARDKRTAKQEEVALIHATDWQRSKVTESYNSEICDARVNQFAYKVSEITEIMRADHPVRHGVVLFTGDMLEGCKIFPGQEWEVDATLFEQLFGVAYQMEQFVKDMLTIFETVEVVAEYGNHGRIGRPSDGFKRSDNFDRIAYEIVRNRLANEDRVIDFKQSPDWYQHHEIGNYAFMAVHGDEIKSFGGNLPAYGIMRKANSWATGVVEPFRDLYIGHYHQTMNLQLANGGFVYMTGSTESHNEFAAEFVAATGTPSQRINFVHPDKGFVTSQHIVFLD